MGNTYGLDEIDDEPRKTVDELEKRSESADDANTEEVERLKKELCEIKKQLEASKRTIKSTRKNNKARLSEYKEEIKMKDKQIRGLIKENKRNEESLSKLQTQMEMWRNERQKTFTRGEHDETRIRQLEWKLEEAEEKLAMATIAFENWQDVISEQIGDVYRNGVTLDAQRKEQIETLERELFDLREQKMELMVELTFRFDFPF